MWYYCQQPDGEDAFLWGLYDNNGREPATPDLWEDDSYGYRFASTTQEDINWGSFEVQFQRSFRGTNDAAHFRAFAYSIHRTGEPQYVGITSSQGGGHAMVVYRVDGSALYIADPNYPGDLTRRIEYRDGAFVPYQSGANAAEIAAGNSESYESIGLMLKTAMVDWQRLSARWQEFRAGTIGNDRFPQYQVNVVHDDDSMEPLFDGYESEHDRIALRVTFPGVPIGIYVYRDGVLVQPENDGKYSLREGYNLIGIEVWGDVNKNPNNRRWRYIDFQYFNVWYGPDQEVPAGYAGWVLESMEWELQPNFYDEDPYRTGFQWSAQEGSYVASGRFWVGTESGQSAHNIRVEFTDTGSWTPPPSFVPCGELGSIVIATTSDLAVVEGTPEEYGWSATWGNTIMVLIDPGESAGVVQTRATTAGGETASKTVEFDLYPYGTPVEGLIIDLIVMPVTTAGSGKYVYTYVYRVE